MSRKITQDIFVRELKEKHPNLTPLTEYKGSKNNIIVKCNIHNYEFKTKPNWLMSGEGCKYCGLERRANKRKKPIEKVISDLNEVHNSKYEYPNIENEYVNNRSIISFVCPIHGVRTIQALKHLQGQGCQICNESHLEKKIRKLLEEYSIDYAYQYKECCKNNKSVDFYIPKYNIAIECQGIQHFAPIQIFGGETEFEIVVNRDKTKFNELKDGKIKLVYIMNKKHKEYLNNEIFEGIYNENVFFIEDILVNKKQFIEYLEKQAYL